MSMSKNPFANTVINQLEPKVFTFVLALSWVVTIIVVGMSNINWLIPKIWLSGSIMIYLSSIFFHLTNAGQRDADRAKNRMLVMRRTSALLTFSLSHVPLCALITTYTLFWSLPQHGLLVAYVITTMSIITKRRKMSEKHFSLNAAPVTLQNSNKTEFIVLKQTLKESSLLTVAFLGLCHWVY